jgi:hypothetical protein
VTLVLLDLSANGTDGVWGDWTQRLKVILVLLELMVQMVLTD